MTRPIITLTTDFGQRGAYVAQMKGVILSINPEANIVDASHDVPPQDIRQGAQLLADLVDWYPTGTVHVGVVDPGVGTERDIVCLCVAYQYFIAPDNGLLSRVIRNHGLLQQIVLTDPQYWLPEVSATFHGRDIMAPAAAHLSLGLPAENLGRSAEQLIRLTWPEVDVRQHRIEGSVVSFDAFGNLITDITARTLSEAGAPKQMTLCCGDHQVTGLVKTYAAQPPGTLVALIGSSQLLELAVVNGNAAQTLGVDVGERIVIEW